jgi:DNA-binding NarL/FixJ family response regulator
MAQSFPPLTRPVRVAVVEDQTIVCELLADFLSNEVGLTVAIKSNRGRSFFDALKTSRIDLAVLDIALPDMSGLEILSYLKKNERRVKVIVVSATDRGQPLREALQQGADAIVSKAAPLEHLRTAVHTVLAGGIFVDPEAGAVLSQHDDHATAALTSREREVAILVAKGLSSKAIGEQLGISEKTVTNHRTTLMKKIGAHNTADITRHVTDERWI